MERNHDDVLLDFHHHLQKKQKESMDAVYYLYEAFQVEVKQINIRERVRAKHIFCSLASISHDTLLSKHWEPIFMNWLAFDYQNIYGRSFFQQYLMKKKLDEPTLVLGGLLMATVIEPIRILKLVDEKELCYSSYFETGEGILRSKEKQFFNVKKGDILFVRKITLLNQSIILGTYFPSNGKLQLLQDDFKLYHEKNKSVSWRSFLKRNVVKYLDSGNA